jgi:hypothetical protein
MNIHDMHLKIVLKRAAELGLVVSLQSLFGCGDFVVRVEYSETAPDVLLDMFYSSDSSPASKYAARDIDMVCDHIQQMIHTNAGIYE